MIAAWICIRGCVRRAVVEASTDGWQKRVALGARGGGVVRWVLAGTLDRVPHTGEEMDLVRLLSRLSGRISEQGGARSHWWVPSPDGDVPEEGSKGTDPGAGRSGSSRLEDGEPGDGRRRYGFQAPRANWELLTWMAEARDFTRASPHPPIVEPTSILFTDGKSFQLDHSHVGGSSEPFYGLGYRKSPGTFGARHCGTGASWYVGKSGVRGCVLSSSPKTSAELGRTRGSLSRITNFRRHLVRHAQMLL